MEGYNDIPFEECRIIYKTIEGTLSVISPAKCGLSIQQIAEKDVPAGRPYKIISANDLPDDRMYRNAWTVEDSILTDGVGSEEGIPAESAYLVKRTHPDGTSKTEKEVEAEINDILYGVAS